MQIITAFQLGKIRFYLCVLIKSGKLRIRERLRMEDSQFHLIWYFHLGEQATKDFLYMLSNFIVQFYVTSKSCVRKLPNVRI